MNKTDNAAEVGKHKFELAGLGMAPFRFVGVSDNVITYPDGTTKAGSSCDYCFTAIRSECWVKSADGKQFKVGCDCIAKVGDAGLLHAYKTSPAVRQKVRDARRAKALKVSKELVELVETNKTKLAAQPHPRGLVNRETGLPMNYHDYVLYCVGCCGDSGRASWLRTLKKSLTTV